MRRALRPIAQLGCLVAFVWLWQWASDTNRIKAFNFGKPTLVYRALVAWWHSGTLVDATLSTLRVLLVGWVIGTVIGVIVGLLIGTVPIIREIFEPFLVFVNGLPRLILQPFLIIWLGFGFAPKVVLVVMAIWIIVTIAVAQGCQQIPQELVANVRLLGATRRTVARDVYAPSLGLWFVSSARSTFGFAFQATVLSEFVGTNEGLGHLISFATNTLKVNQVYAALIVVMVLALAGNALLSLLESFATRWMPPARR